MYKVFLMTFFLSLTFSFVSNVISSNANLFVMILITFLVIGIGIVFDMIGTASLTSSEATFHAKSSKKIKGAKESLKLLKNSVKVASICNDVIGDIKKPVVTNFSSGHCKNMITIPFGTKCEINTENNRIRILEDNLY